MSVFVENRLKEIRNGNITLRFVISEDNPADLATRGISAQELSESQLWWHGPRWLRDPETSWPTWNIPEINPDTIRAVESEIRGPKVLYETSQLAAQTLEPNVTLELIPELQDDMNDVEFELKMNTSSALLEAWKRGQRHLNQFWKVWRDQYLQSL